MYVPTEARKFIGNPSRQFTWLHFPFEGSPVLLPYQYHSKQTDVLQQFKKGRKICFMRIIKLI